MRILHTMLRVRDLEKSIAFYTDILGMNLQRRTDYKGGKFTLAFLGYGDPSSEATLELTYNWDTNDYDHGNAYGHLAIEVDDIYKTCDEIVADGGNLVRPAGPMKHGTTIIAFVKDPDGYMIELIGA